MMNKSKWFLPLQIAVIPIVIYFILKKIDISAIFVYFKQVKISSIALCALSIIGSFFFASVRNNIYLKSRGIELSIFDSFNIFMRGAFFNNFLPTGIGGDGYKLVLLQKNTYLSYASGIKLLLSERSSGLYIILVLSSIMLMFSGDIYVSSDHVSAIHFQNLKQYILGAFIIIVSLAYFIIDRYILSNDIRTTLKVIPISMMVQTFAVLSQMVLLNDFGISIFDIKYLISVLLSFIALLLPISISSAAMREGGLVVISGFIAISATKAVAGATTFFMINMIVILICSILFKRKINF